MDRAEPITVVIGCCDHLLTAGLARLLNEDPQLSLVDYGLSNPELEEHVAHRVPCVVMVDEDIAPDTLARLKSQRRSPGIIVIADSPVHLFGMLLVQAGVTCLPRTSAPAQIHAAIRLAAQGKPRLFIGGGDFTPAGRNSDPGLLTTRETQVFRHLSRGRSYAEIGRRLHISPETARKHTASICRKVQKTRLELIGMSLPNDTVWAE